MHSPLKSKQHYVYLSFFFFAAFQAMHAGLLTEMASSSAKNHAANRTVAEWVRWAEGEGFTDLVERAPDADGDPEPGITSLSPSGCTCTFFQARFIASCVHDL